jgi:hypothetical protein
MSCDVYIGYSRKKAPKLADKNNTSLIFHKILTGPYREGISPKVYFKNKFGDIGHIRRYWHFRRYGHKNKFFRSKMKNA